jgi:hypothetical protein
MATKVGGEAKKFLAGALNAFSAMISYRPAKRVKAACSQVTGGLASGYSLPCQFRAPGPRPGELKHGSD